jgi:dihydroorotate dehydrogenase
MSSFEFTGRLGHLTNIESPWGNAGGVVKTVEDAEQMACTGVGWIEAGSYTLEARAGNGANGERAYYHDPITGETFNALGMPNEGMDQVVKEIPKMARVAHAYRKPLVVNVAPVSHNPAVESIELVQRAYQAGADAVILNAGCPNVITAEGGRHQILSYNISALHVTLQALQATMRRYKPIFVRLSPYDTAVSMRPALDIVKKSGVVSAVFTPNTWSDHRPTDTRGEAILQVPGGTGGKSGPATAHEASHQTHMAVNLLRPFVDVVSSSGIMSGRALAERLSIGAVAGCGTTFYYESPDWRHDTDQLLEELAA